MASEARTKTSRQIALEEWRRNKDKAKQTPQDKVKQTPPMRPRTSSTNSLRSNSTQKSSRTSNSSTSKNITISNRLPSSSSLETPIRRSSSPRMHAIPQCNTNSSKQDEKKQVFVPITPTNDSRVIEKTTPDDAKKTIPQSSQNDFAHIDNYNAASSTNITSTLSCTILWLYEIVMSWIFPKRYERKKQNDVMSEQLLQTQSKLKTALAERDDYISAFEEAKERMYELFGDVTNLGESLKTCKRAEAQAVEQVRILQEKLQDYDAIKNELIAVRVQFQSCKHEWVPRTEMDREIEILQNNLKEVTFQLRISQEENNNMKDEKKDSQSAEEQQRSKDRDDISDPQVAKALLQEKEESILSLKMQLAEGEILRRRMHNRIQELRGNIRTYVRVRPFISQLDKEIKVNDDDNKTLSAIKVIKDGDALVLNRTDNGGRGSQHPFQFNRVFGPWNSQNDVFDEVSDFIQSAMDGYNVCLFSYGQTGSGKTHTMQGSGKDDQRGIISRAVEQILEQAALSHTQSKLSNNESEVTYSLQASFLEIYNESLRDLLVVEDDNLAALAKSDNLELGCISSTNTVTAISVPPKKAQKLAMRKDPNDGRMYVEGLTTISIDTTSKERGMSQLFAVMDIASRSRSVAATKMNLESSRSHSIFILKVVAIDSVEETTVNGTLNLVDLAGSERLSRSESNADSKLLKEAQAINSSLSCLGDVFVALANDASHVPYRNSKLTYLLQDCLGGDGKTCMFVNLSPTTKSCNESLCSLRFAQRVSKVELGKATKSVQLTKN